MTRALKSMILIALAALLSGCVTNTRKGNAPLDELMRVVAASPERYRVIVSIPSLLASPESPARGSTNEFPVASDGRVAFHVPQMRAGYKTQLCGILPLYDDTPSKYYVIKIRRYEPHWDADVYQMRLRDLPRFQRDSDGYRVIHVE
jgi:hypothetical protein